MAHTRSYRSPQSPGVGSKTAERVILDLKDKVSIEDSLNQLGGDTELISSQDISCDNEMKKDAIEALTALGYSRTDAISAVNKVLKDDAATTEEVLKKALKYLI